MLHWDENLVLTVSFSIFALLLISKCKKPILKSIDQEIDKITQQLDQTLLAKNDLEKKLDDEQLRRINIKNQERTIVDNGQHQLAVLRKEYEEKLSFFEKKRSEQHHAGIKRLEELFGQHYASKIIDAAILSVQYYFLSKTGEESSFSEPLPQLLKETLANHHER